MTLEQAIKQAKEHAKAHNLTAYVHTDSTLGHNFRFMRPIEDVESDHRKARTVATVSPAGEVSRLESFDEYTKALWPANVPQDCTEMLSDEGRNKLEHIRTGLDYMEHYYPDSAYWDLAEDQISELLDPDPEDCLEQNRHESHQCDSCRTYSRLAADWEERNGSNR